MSGMSIAFTGAMKEVKGHCKTHGDFTATVFVRDGKEGDPQCHECFQLAEESDQRHEREQIEIARVQRYEAQRVKRCDIPPRLIAKGYKDYKPPNDTAQSHVGECKSYAENWGETKAQGANIIMCGTPGTGKTHLACVICRQIATQNNAQPRYTTVSRMMRHIRSSYNRDSEISEDQILQQYINADLLAIDEVGVKLSSDHERSMLFEIIDERYQNLMPTIVISNLTIGEIGRHTDERIVDRLSENGLLMIFDWDSHRGGE